MKVNRPTCMMPDFELVTINVRATYLRLMARFASDTCEANYLLEQDPQSHILVLESTCIVHVHVVQVCTSLLKTKAQALILSKIKRTTICAQSVNGK